MKPPNKFRQDFRLNLLQVNLRFEILESVVVKIRKVTSILTSVELLKHMEEGQEVA